MTHFHVLAAGGNRIIQPQIRQIGVSDLLDALSKGMADFASKPSHIVFLCLIYPVIGVLLAAWSSGHNVLQLLFPLASGFALIGPLRCDRSLRDQPSPGTRRRRGRRATRWPSSARRQFPPLLPSRPCCWRCSWPGS